MGQCVARQGVGSYAPIISSDSLSTASWVYPGGYGTRKYDRGHSESKGAKKRSTTRGVATSFGFRKRPASSSRIPNKTAADCISGQTDGTDNDLIYRRSKTPNSLDKNGNGGSPVTSGRSTPLARPRKEVLGAPLRTNRFGFRQTGPPKTAKVSDVNPTIEQAFNLAQKDEQPLHTTETEEESNINNNPLDKHTNKYYDTAPRPLRTDAIKPADVPKTATINQPVRTTTKQTVILTYTTQQYTTHANVSQRNRSLGANRNAEVGSINPRSKSAGRAYPTTGNYSSGNPKGIDVGKYRLQSTQLPKPQYPAVTVLDSKTAKQVANNSRKVYGATDSTVRNGASANSNGLSKYDDSSVPISNEVGSDGKPRRPRNLEMVMRNAHSFHLRELQVTDLDIMDEAVVTDSGMIPLPKLPSILNQTEEIQYPTSKAFAEWQASREATDEIDSQKMRQILENSTSSRIADLHNSITAANIQLRNNWMTEEKGNRDRIQHEKKAAFMNMSTAPPRAPSPLTRSSSKESSPSSRSEEVTAEPTSWARSAGEAMARRSQDDISTELSISSCDDERSRKELSRLTPPEIPQANISIIDSTLSSISKPVKYLENYSSEIILPSMLMSTSTLSGSTFSGTSATMTNLGSNSIAYLMENSKLDLAALETSTHSMLDDETSPADSLISSSSDSNNDLVNIEEKEHYNISLSSSAYQTANTKSKSTNVNDLEFEEDILESNIVEDESEKKSKDESPLTPGTPTNASNSLSLSDGRDFLIDDEIADQPGLVFENNSSADQGTPPKGIEDRHRLSPPKKTNASPQLQLKKKGPQRTPSLDTLSSIGSDDLMMDLELGRSITSLQSGDDCQEKANCGSLVSNLSSLGEAQLKQEFMNELSLNKYSALKHWNHLLDQNTQLDKQLAAMGHHVNHSNCTSTSSIANIGASLPARTARLLSRSRAADGDAPDASRASDASGAGGRTPRPGDARLDRQTHAAMLHDVVAIKTLLLKLKRVLQEPEEEISLSTETLDPLSSEMTESNGLFLRLAESEGCTEEREGRGGDCGSIPTTPAHHREELADLRRQIVFLQSQLEDRERVVKHLQEQMSKCSDSSDSSRVNGHSNEETCNAATQTDRLRPLSTGPNILQNISDGHAGLVSWSEQKRTISESAPLPSRLRKPSVQINNQSGNVAPRCQCMLRKLNGQYTNGISEMHSQTANSIENLNQIKANGRVGSRYLQAIAGKQSPSRFIKKEVVGNERALRSRSLYGTRSKSIENVNNNIPLSASNNNLNHYLKDNNMNLISNRGKHHNSYSNLLSEMLNGDQVDNKDKITPNDYTNHNGQSTDTDDNSDSGYKSLPPVLNLAQNRISGIPRRSDAKFISMRSSQIY